MVIEGRAGFYGLSTTAPNSASDLFLTPRARSRRPISRYRRMAWSNACVASSRRPWWKYASPSQAYASARSGLPASAAVSAVIARSYRLLGKVGVAEDELDVDVRWGDPRRGFVCVQGVVQSVFGLVRAPEFEVGDRGIGIDPDRGFQLAPRVSDPALGTGGRAAVDVVRGEGAFGIGMGRIFLQCRAESVCGEIAVAQFVGHCADPIVRFGLHLGVVRVLLDGFLIITHGRGEQGAALQFLSRGHEVLLLRGAGRTQCGTQDQKERTVPRRDRRCGRV